MVVATRNPLFWKKDFNDVAIIKIQYTSFRPFLSYFFLRIKSANIEM